MSTGLEAIVESQRMACRNAMEADRHIDNAVFVDEEGIPRIAIFFRLGDEEQEENILPKQVVLAALTSVFRADHKCKQMTVAIDSFCRRVSEDELEEFESSGTKLRDNPLAEEAISHYTLKKEGEETLIRVSIDRYGYNDDGSIIWREPNEVDTSEFLSMDVLDGGMAMAFKIPPLLNQDGEPYEVKDLLETLSVAQDTFNIKVSPILVAEMAAQGGKNESN